MKKRTLKKMTVGLGLLAGVSLMSACTKTVPYDSLYKEKVHAKSEIDADAEYLYVASSDASSRDDMGTSNATPYMQGQEKIVKFRFTEDSLRVVEVEDDARLKSNELNEKILLEIPVEHVEYRCAEDRYGKCTNREEKNDEKNWSKKANFIPDFNKIMSPGLSLLPVESGKLWGDSCYKETSSRFLDYKMEKGALNIQVEKTFTASIDCLNSLNGLQTLSDLQSRIVYHYSFTKLKDISSKDYKVVSYPRQDEGTFGFFSTEYRKYDVDFTRTEKMRQDFMNRWNPNRKEVVYYLTENFDKPEFAAIKKASQTAFDRVNQGLKDAGIDLRLTLKSSKDKASGDARNSMLIMVEDPVAGGPLGYGPSVANPRTGEILSARVVMYYGNMLQGLSMTYDELVKEMKLEKKNGELFKSDAAVDGKKASASMNGRVLSDELKHDMSVRNSITSRLAAKMAKDASQSYLKLQHESLKKGSQNLSSSAQRWSTEDIGRMNEKQFMKMTMQTAAKSSPEDRIAAMSSGHCMYPSELFPFDEAIAKGLDQKLSGNLKPWEDLSDAEKNEVIALVGPEIWIPTLIHEIGHNLGLRHNFGGSEDKDNFYSAAELAKMNVKHKVPYSSVMDYGQRELNLLPTLGKYDIAALKFGYLRQVEKNDGKVVEVKTTLKDLAKADSKLELKDYQYCTDEHVEVNPNCKRFDEGTTRTEIVTSLINQYEKFYNLRNLRRGRENFSQMTDRGYMSRIRSNFGYIRAFMENYEMIKARFKVADNDPAWTQAEWLADVKKAALLSGRFFANVLKTPDLHCAIARRSEPNKLVAIEFIDAFGQGGGVDCFKDVQLKEEFVVVGQGGKSFKSRKDPRSENSYMDQIDVRGVWIDKLVAAEALFARRIGNFSFDRVEDNYLDISDLSEEITGDLISILFNNVQSDITFADQNGNEFTVPKAVHKMFSTPDSFKSENPTHWIERPLDSGLANRLGITKETSFQEALLKIVSGQMNGSKSHWAEDRDFLDRFTILKTSKAQQLDTKGVAGVKDIGSIRVVALPENALARNAMSISTIGEMLSKLSKEQLDQLVAERQNGVESTTGVALLANPEAGAQAAPATTKFPEFKVVPTQYIELFRQGALLDANMLNYLLTILPAQN